MKPNQEEIVDHLNALAEEGTEGVHKIQETLGQYAKTVGMSQVARDAGLSREGLYKALSHDSKPTFTTIFKAIQALGLKLKFEKR